MIITEVRGQWFSISKGLISKVLNAERIKCESRALGLLPPPKKYPRKVLTSTVLRKIDLLTTKKYPPTQKHIPLAAKMSTGAVHKA